MFFIIFDLRLKSVFINSASGLLVYLSLILLLCLIISVFLLFNTYCLFGFFSVSDIVTVDILYNFSGDHEIEYNRFLISTILLITPALKAGVDFSFLKWLSFVIVTLLKLYLSFLILKGSILLTLVRTDVVLFDASSLLFSLDSFFVEDY